VYEFFLVYFTVQNKIFILFDAKNLCSSQCVEKQFILKENSSSRFQNSLFLLSPYTIHPKFSTNSGVAGVFEIRGFVPGEEH